MFPNTPGVVTGTNAEVSNHKSLSIPPRTWNGPTWFGVCVVPGALSKLPLDVKFIGVPLIQVRMPLSCQDRKSTRLNSSHGYISYAVFCLKKKNKHARLHELILWHYLVE